ncbi:hypothetical protein [Chroococcidiopsis cubana]|nr:hypothetical protein [Chroococcidiopsis cubana]
MDIPSKEDDKEINTLPVRAKVEKDLSSMVDKNLEISEEEAED